MKKNIFLLVIFVALIWQNSFAQQWKQNLPQGKSESEYTFFDYQKAFNDYWAPYNVEGGWYVNSKGEKQKAGGWKQFKRWEWYWEPRVDRTTGEFPDKTAWEVWQDYKSANNIKSVGGTWTSRGDAVLDPIDGGSIQESGTGRLNCAFFDPSDNNHYLVGAPAGGLWETFDNGTTWTCLTDNNPIVGVSDIALPPDYNATTNKTIFIATGDRDAGDDPSIGVLKTTDGGVTWTQTGLTFNDESGVQIGRLIINPDNKNIMWAATSIGVYKSTDAGNNWTFVQGGRFIDMELIPGSTGTGNGTLIATTTGWTPKVYRTADGGNTWTNTWTATANEYRCDVAVTPANTNYVYITTADGANNMAFYGLYRSTDGGVSFTQVYSGTSNNNLYGWYENNSETDGGQGWYDATLAVSNTNANVVYVGGVNGYISTNGGSSFTICNAWDSGISADVIHADHHNAYFRLSDNRLFDVNDGGIYYCDDVTSGSSSTWYSKTDGLVTGQLYDIGVAQTKNNEIIFGFQDNGTKLCKVSTTDFDQVIGGDGMCCAINPTNNTIMYGTYAQMRVYKSTNEGGSFSIIRNSGGGDWAGPVEADPNGGEVFIGDDRVKQYSGSGTTWNNKSQSLAPSPDYLKTLAVYNDGTNIMIWTGSVNGVWKSPLGGGSGSGYTAIAGLPADAVTDIDIDDDDYNHVYVCFGGYNNNNVYETTDGGASWTDISQGLPPVPCGAIVINEQNTTKHEVYVGTDAGIFVKLGNAPWQLFNDGIPFVSITDLEIYYDAATPANTRIYAATYGRGVWSSDCYEPPTLDATVSYINTPVEEYCETGSITPSVQLGNIGTTTLTSADIAYTIDGGAPVSYHWTGSLAQGATTDITFPAVTTTYGTHNFVATVSNPNGSTDSNSDNDTKSKTYAVWDNSVPYTQNFDDFTIAVEMIGSSVILQECWSNDETESSLDWSVNQGATASVGTGPDTYGDHTSGAGKYLYTETSGISASTNVNLLSPTFDLTNYTNATISFWYHMLGTNMGSLRIDLFYGGTWHNSIAVSWNGGAPTTTPISGNQADQWRQATADISAADGYSDVQIRFYSMSAADYTGDMAIDDFNLNADVNCVAPTTQASNFGATPSYTSMALTWTRGNGDNLLIIAKAGSAVDANPTFGVNYTANATFGLGQEIGTGNYVIYNGTATGMTLSGLTEGTTYHFAFYEYNNTDVCYLMPAYTANATTLVSPPSITSVSPDNFFTDKGKQLTVSGTHLENVTSVTIGGVTGTINAQNATSITVTFPAGNYSNNTLTATNSAGNDTYTVTVNKRNTIPVGGGTDYHTTIQSALDGLFAWYGTTSFDAGQLSGTKYIDVYTGTYTENVTPNVSLNPSATNRLVIQNHTGEAPVINATGLANGFNIGALNNVTVTGFSVYGANNDNIYTEGDNNIISYNKSYSSVGGSGIKLSAANNSTVNNNLVYNNYNYGVHLAGNTTITVKNNTAYGNGHSYSASEVHTYSWSGSTNIPDNNTAGVSIPISVSDVSTVTNVRVLNMNITHPYDADLDISLVHPDATSINLSSDNGGSGNNYTNTNFDDAAATAITAGSAPFTGTYRPEVALSAFDTKATNGTWNLKVADDATGDVGTVTGWQLELTFNVSNNAGACVYVESGSGTTVENNIFYTKTGTNYVALQTASGVTVTSDYNTYYKNGNTNLVNYNGSVYADLAAWTGNGAGANELESDPLFVNAGTDFHIQSANDSYHGGEWPPVTASTGTWTTDASTSPALDAGNPADTYSNEPVSGSRINQGCYGNTVQASKSATPCTQPTITLGTNPSVCSGTTSANLSYSATTESPDKYSIDFDATAEAQGFSDVTLATLPSSPIVIAVPGGAAAGTYNATLTVTNSSTSCTSDDYSITVTINQNLAVSVSIAADANPVCEGTNVTFTATPTNGGTTPAYQWYKNTVSQTGETAATYSYTPANGDDIYVILTSNISCPSGNPATSNTVTMTVNPLPVAPTSVTASSTTICNGESTTLSYSGGSGTTFRWMTGSCGGTSVGTGNNLSVSPTATTTYYGRWENSCGNSSCQSVTITVNPLPTAPTSVSASPNPITLGNSTTLSYSGGSGTTFNWYSGSCGGTSVGTGQFIRFSNSNYNLLWTLGKFLR